VKPNNHSVGPRFLAGFLVLTRMDFGHLDRKARSGACFVGCGDVLGCRCRFVGRDPVSSFLSRRRFGTFRQGVAFLCMVLAILLSGQTFISLMDNVDHAHHHVHFANPLAGDVQFCGGEHDACGPHHHHHEDAGDHHGTGGTPDHRHGDAALVFLAAQILVFAICPVAGDRCDEAPMSFVTVNPQGRDRPPKPDLANRI
jgi:hypothetical protein